MVDHDSYYKAHGGICLCGEALPIPVSDFTCVCGRVFPKFTYSLEQALLLIWSLHRHNDETRKRIVALEQMIAELRKRIL